ncbi:MAG: amino acid permease [Planctomycetes bacterium]|nr:amino acid permease [Planctomycetota bacterium]
MSGAGGRHIGLFGATGIGVGAIVGGGILALAGTAFATTGPGALVAFALNGVISIVTALSLAELASAYPQSGGTYVAARRVLSVGAAFNVGWIVWFASIVAAALYALGFASFALGSIAALAPDLTWAGRPGVVTATAVATTALCTLLLCRSPGSGGNGVNVLKVVVFSALILGGAWAWWRDAPPALERLQPLFPGGAAGLFTAMGYTYIALQGFDLIAAVAGEVKEPRRVLPRAMLLSLAISLAVYLPLLLLIPVVGVPSGETLASMAARHPEGLVARAAGAFLGPTGFWLVMGAGVLSMLSALLANLFAASRIAQAMARDRTLPVALERVDADRGTPAVALAITGAIVGATLLVVSDVASAGAASSLIFLVTFALAHLLCIVARVRRPDHEGFRAPGWPALPAMGALACGALAVFQGVTVPAAGVITGAWLVLGAVAYLGVLAPRARIVDAASEAADPELLALRGRSPLVLVPVANPVNAPTLAAVAACLSPPRLGRILLLNVVAPPASLEDAEHDLAPMSRALSQSLAASLRAGVTRVECMATVSGEPWPEIARVSALHRCDVTLLGMSSLSDPAVRARLEDFAGRMPGNLAILRAAPGWQPALVRRVLVPMGGRGVNNALRARLLTALHGASDDALEVRYLVVVPPGTTEARRAALADVWTELVKEESEARSTVEVVEGADVAGLVLARAADSDLLVLGINRVDRSRRVFGPVITRLVDDAPGAVMVIGQRE